MDKMQVRHQAWYGLLLEAVVDGTLVVNGDGVITAPEVVVKNLCRVPNAPTAPEVRAILVPYALGALSDMTTLDGCVQLMQLLTGDDMTTTLAAQPVVRVCHARRLALDADATLEHEDWFVQQYRVIRTDGSLVLDATADWQPNAAALDLACMYHFAHYVEVGQSADDEQALTMFVQRYVDLLAPIVLWDYVDKALLQYLEVGEGAVTMFLDPIALREFGRRLYAREAFMNYLADEKERRHANLVALGFVEL